MLLRLGMDCLAIWPVRSQPLFHEEGANGLADGKLTALGHVRRACMAHKRSGAGWRLPQQRRGLWCGIREKTVGSKTDDWNCSPRSAWQGAGPGYSGDYVIGPNVPAWLTRGPNVLGGLSNGPHVRERWRQPTSAPCRTSSS